jgi:hypothetical protein
VLILVRIDLSQADLVLFNRYEEQVLRLLDTHSGRLEMRVRSVDHSSETHLLFFESRKSFDEFLADPARAELQPEWQACKATSYVSEVQTIS